MARAGFCNTIIYILSLYLAQTGAHSDPCMKDWKEVPGFGVCIRAFPLKKTFEEAIDYCAEFGADLVKIWNPTMNDVVTGLTKETGDVFYIGLKFYMRGTKKYSRWRGDGRQARYKNWRKGKLINKQKACAVIGHDGKWIEWDCTDKQKFVCGKASRLCPSSFFFSSYSGTCIRFIYKKLDWDSANEFCQENLDAKLVRIINKRMNEFLSDRDIHIGSFPLWMDFDGRKIIDDSRWLNSTIGYTNWASGQPGNTTPICSGIHTSTRNWYNYNCSIPRYVICEKFPTCPFFTYGLNCQENCSENCAGLNKTCDPIDGTCILGCKAGYQGEKCNEACSVFTYGLNCQENCSEHCAGANKTCDPTNGTCILGCEVGYQGEKCNEACSVFTYGLNCQENCSEHCAGANKTCDPTNGTCILGCEVGYQGEKCYKACPYFTYGLYCQENCSENCAGPNKTCDPLDGTCILGCKAGYQGEKCNEACSVFTYGLNCQENCSEHCVGPNKTCDPTNGTCILGCEVGYEGEKCYKACPFFTYGLYCQENCSENCAGPNKTCDPIDGTCILGCKAGYQGEKCNKACSVFTYGLNCQENCSEHCAGPNKTCDPTNGTCILGCEVGYQGEKCYKECSFFTYGLNCQENCSENCAGPNKTCDPTNGTCILGCEVGYQGETCDKGILNIAFLTPEARTGYSNLAIVSASSFAAIVLLICVAPALCRKKTDTGTQEPQQHVEDIAVSSQPEANEDHYPSKMPDTNSGLDFSPSNDEQETWLSEQSSVEDEEYED